MWVKNKYYLYKDKYEKIILALTVLFSINSISAESDPKTELTAKDRAIAAVVACGLLYGSVKCAQWLMKQASIFTHDAPERFTDIGGCCESIDQLQSYIDCSRRPNELKALGAHLSKGIFYYGFSGVGKKIFSARAFAGELGSPYCIIDAKICKHMSVYQMQKSLNQIIGAASLESYSPFKTVPPVIVCIDNIHLLSTDAVEHLSLLMGHINEQKSNIILVGLTNKINQIHNELDSSGCFDIQIRVGFPAAQGREEILNFHLKDTPSKDLDTRVIALQTREVFYWSSACRVNKSRSINCSSKRFICCRNGRL